MLEFYEGRDSPYDEDMVRRDFLSPDEYTERFIVNQSERPIGYLQLYPVHPAKRHLYGVGEDEAPFGMDLFIGEPDLWGPHLTQARIDVHHDYDRGRVSGAYRGHPRRPEKRHRSRRTRSTH